MTIIIGFVIRSLLRLLRLLLFLLLLLLATRVVFGNGIGFFVADFLDFFCFFYLVNPQLVTLVINRNPHIAGD